MVDHAPRIQKRAAADALHAVGDDDRVQIAALVKCLVVDLADAVRDDDARQIGAVNVIKFTKGLFGKLKLKGYNSDIIGFKQSIDPLLKETHRKALILGTGGASKAVFHGLKQLGVGATLVSRKPKEFCITYDEITPKTMEQYTVIVNTTPLGMFPNIDSCPDIPYDLLTPNHLLYDLLYNPDETLFMKKGADKGAITKNGLEMLLLQAFGAWDIWNK